MELTIQNLSKQYRNGVKALDQINLTISSGLFGLLGPNGAGKTTLMKTLATLLDPDTGKAFFNGMSIFDQQQAFRKQLGYLPQEFGFPPQVKAITLLNHVALMKGIGNQQERQQLVVQMLEQVNLLDKAHQKLSSYSGGMKQRFGLALTLIGDPKLIIVDEPTTGLDPMERHRFYNLLSQLAQDRIIIISTHIVEDINRLCQNFAILRKGQLLLASDLKNIQKDYEGKVWQKAVSTNDLAFYEDNHFVLTAHYEAGEPLVRIYSDELPDSGFAQVEASLEDVYFHFIKQNHA
ncbi:MAG: ABC transporter ATP-binding protein [Flammeovirgaceae bacterium]